MASHGPGTKDGQGGDSALRPPGFGAVPELSPQARIYLVLVIVAGYLALGELMHRSTAPPAAKLGVLLLLAVTCGPLLTGPWPLLRPGQSDQESEAGLVSVSLLFVFSAMLELPGRYAALVAMAAGISQLALGAKRKPRLRDYLVVLASTNLSLLVAYDAHHLLQAHTRVGALAAAATMYFLVNTWSRAAALSLQDNLPVAATWWREFLPTAPLYGLLAAGAAALGVVLDPSNLHLLIAVFPVICLFYYCYEFYFGRLRAERRYAQEMAEMHRRTVEALALAIDAKDRTTSGHLRRVQRYAVEVGRQLGCSAAQLKALEVGAALHDIGKIAVPERLLSKPGKLTTQEFKQVAIHPQVGAEILAAVKFPFPVAELVHSHHENWDGSGYPRGLKGSEIPLTARILSVADCFDALLSDRPYRAGLPLERAVEMLCKKRGTAFDPQVVDAMLEILPRMQAELEEPAGNARPALQTPRAIPAVQTSLTATERGLDTRHLLPALPEGEGLRRLLDRIGAGRDLEDICRVAVSELGQLVPCDAAAAFVLEGVRLIAIYQTWPESLSRESLEVAVDGGPTGWAVRQAGTLVNGNPATESGELAEAARLYQWRDALIVPLWSASRVVGTLNLYAIRSRVYTERHARIVELATANMGISIINTRPAAAALDQRSIST